MPRAIRGRNPDAAIASCRTRRPKTRSIPRRWSSTSMPSRPTWTTWPRCSRPPRAKLRAHAKTHKSPVIAHLQMARGAVGPVRAEGGGGGSAGLGRGARHPGEQRGGGRGQARPPRRAGAHRADRGLRRRCRRRSPPSRPPPRRPACACRCWWRSTSAPAAAAWRPGPEAVALARRIAASAHICASAACRPTTAAPSTSARRRNAAAGSPAPPRARGARWRQLRQQGLDCPIVGGGGTGSFMLEAGSGVFTELQAGSYVFMDADYGRNLDEAGQPVTDLPPCAVRARHGDERAAARAGGGGRRAQGGGGGQRPAARSGNAPTCATSCASDEHGKLEVRRRRRARRNSARSCAWFPGTAIRRSIATIGMSACAAGGSNACGRSRRAGRWRSGGGRGRGSAERAIA